MKKRVISKPSFLRIFADRVFVVAIVAAIGFALVILGLSEKYYKELSELEVIYKNYIMDTIVNDLLSSGKEELSNNAKILLSQDLMYVQTATGKQMRVFYDGEIIADNDPKVIVRVNEKWYSCSDPDVIEGLASYRMDWFDAYNDHPLTEARSDCYYVDDSTQTFRPGVVDGVDYAPDNLDGWQKIDVNPNEQSMLVSAVIEEPNYSSNSRRDIEVNGQTHTIHIRTSDLVYNTEYLYTHKTTVSKIMIAFIVVAIIVAVSWSLITFYRRKSIYDMFSYRSSLTSKLAHDLKTPLMAISSYSENLSLDPAGEKSDHYTKGILDNVYYMNDMISEVLQLAVSEGERIVNDSKEINLKQVIDGILEKLESQINSKNLVVTVGEFDKPYPKTDGQILCNALSCLIENAVKYATADSEIKIHGTNGSFVEVINTFEGTIENINKLTEPFVRGNSERGELGGSGLGLAIAKEDFKTLGYKLNVQVNDNVFCAKVKYSPIR